MADEIDFGRAGRGQELFGPVLDEPGSRFELEVALRARELLRRRPVPQRR
jgi:hypothetical protein